MPPALMPHYPLQCFLQQVIDFCLIALPAFAGKTICPTANPHGFKDFEQTTGQCGQKKGKTAEFPKLDG